MSERAERVKAQAREQMNGYVRQLRQMRAADVTPEKINWIWPGRLARGKISLLEGDPGLGKSTITIEIASRLSTGARLPWGVQLPPTGTMFLSAEDGVADTIVPRLIAAGADMERIWIVDGIDTVEGEDGVQIPRDLDLLEQSMSLNDCSLVVVDPLSVFLGDEISENKNQEVRKALAPAKAMFERAKVAGLLLRHLTKSQSANPVYRGAGSIGLGGAARFVMMVGEDPEVPDVRVLANVKENIRTKDPVPSLAYKVASWPSDTDIACIEWVGESQWKSKDLQAVLDEEEGDRLREAKEWLADYLGDGRMVLAKQVEKDARAAGHAWRTIERAKKAVGAKSIKNPIDGVWAWHLDTMRIKTATETVGDRQARPPSESGSLTHAIDGVGGLGTLLENTKEKTSSSSCLDGGLLGGLLGGLPPNLESERLTPPSTPSPSPSVEGSDPPW